MCGIAGFTHKAWSPAPDRIRAATATLTHRGPDEQGTFSVDVCSMGATRLKILDLVGGDQPITSDDGDITIVFNGEIYNHLELRSELQALGHRFHSHCDTETVLHAFVQWDTAAFARLRGMFGVALWQTSGRRLVLARDRIGIKPLYIHRRGQDLFFGSELKAILVHPEIGRRISLSGLDCYLSLNYVPAPWTLIHGIEKLMPGHWLEWRDGQVRIEAYWRLPREINPHSTLDSAREELDWLLKQAVPEHLLSDVPLGVWLSGGVDSTTILHYAATAGTRLKTFSISFAGRSFDETPYIKRAVEAYGTDHVQFDLNPEEDLQSAIEELPYYSDEPSADAGALPVWFLSKLCKTQTTVALSGEGADELFGGYLTYRANRIARSIRRLPVAARRAALSALAVWPASNEKIGLDYKLQRFLNGSLLPPDQAHVYWNGTFSEAEKEELIRLPLPGAFDELLGDIRRSSAIQADDLAPYLQFDQQYYLADDILVKSDRMSMAHAVEVRPAFLDHRIVEFAATLPASLKIRGSRQKFLLKELMKDKLPAAILQRAKTGFDIPAHEWLRGPLKPLLDETLRWGLSQYSELFRPDVVQSYFERHAKRRMNVGYHLWGLLILFLWMKKWRVQPPASSPAFQAAPERVGQYI